MATRGPEAAAATVEDAGVVDQQSAAAPAEGSFEPDLTFEQPAMQDQAAPPRRGLPANLIGQASDRARDYATLGKDAATDRLESFAGLISGLADALGDKLGPQTGDYARRASETVAQFTEGLKNKDVDDLVDDTRRIIKQNPAMAVGAAAALGFVLVRLAKAGNDDEQDDQA